MKTERNEEHEIDAELDELLRGHFADALDAHVGRARAAFERHVAETTRTIHVISPGRARQHRRAWMIGAAGAGLAASLAAAVFVLPALRTPERTVTDNHLPQATDNYFGEPPEQPPTAAPGVMHAMFQFQEVDRVRSSFTQDQGVVYVGDGNGGASTPARVVRELAVERVRWVDENTGVKIETVVPRVDMKLIQLETH